MDPDNELHAKKLLDYFNLCINNLQVQKYIHNLTNPTDNNVYNKYTMSLSDVCGLIKYKKEFIDRYKLLYSKNNMQHTGSVLYIIGKILRDGDMKKFIEDRSYSLLGFYDSKTTDGTIVTDVNNHLLSDHKKRIQYHHLISFRDRKNLRRDFLYLDKISTDKSDIILETQLVYDIIYIIHGYQGRLIKVEIGKDKYILNQGLDNSTQLLVSKFYNISQNYSIFTKYIDRNLFNYSKGTVINTFSLCINHIYNDYLVFISQLENVNDLDINKLLYLVQSYMILFHILSYLIKKIELTQKRSCDILDVLYQSLTIFPENDICDYLYQNVLSSYITIVNHWLYNGKICDVFNEFFVKENNTIKYSNYSTDNLKNSLDQKYVLRLTKIPIIFKNLAYKIYKIGIGLNILRNCDYNEDLTTNFEVINYQLSNDIAPIIEQQFIYTGQMVLNMLIKKYDLLMILASLKYYFLIEKGDFLIHFIDSAQKELLKTVDQILPLKLESLLEISLRTSTANIDPYKDNLSISLCSEDIVAQLTSILTRNETPNSDKMPNKNYLLNKTLLGAEVLSFDFKLQWPINIIINGKALIRYQILFRHIFYLHHIENNLAQTWQQLMRITKTKKFDTSSYSGEDQLRVFLVTSFLINSNKNIYLILNLMIIFVQILLYYLKYDVIEPYWTKFIQDIGGDGVKSNANGTKPKMDLDTICNLHLDTLSSIMHSSMLNDLILLKLINKIIKLCESYSNFLEHSFAHTLPIEAKNINQQQTSFKSQIKFYDSKFKESLYKLYIKLHDTTCITSMNQNLIHFIYKLDTLVHLFTK